MSRLFLLAAVTGFFIGSSFANDFCETSGRTKPFTLKAGNHGEPAGTVFFQKAPACNGVPALSVEKIGTRAISVAVNIPGGSTGQYLFAAYDLRGRPVMKREALAAGRIKFGFQLPSGYYLLCLRSGKTAVYRTVVVY